MFGFFEIVDKINSHWDVDYHVGQENELEDRDIEPLESMECFSCFSLVLILVSIAFYITVFFIWPSGNTETSDATMLMNEI